MKYFGIAALALAMSVGASASTLTALCGVFATSAPQGTFFTSGSGVVASGSVTCNVQALPPFSTFVSEAVILQTDYTGGLQGSANGIQTVYTGSLINTDTLSSSGVGGSTVYADSFNNLYPGFVPAYYWVDGSTANNSASFTVNYSTTVTSGQVQGVSGQVYELITYTSAVPEPGSMMLLGGGLIAVSLISRKKFARK